MLIKKSTVICIIHSKDSEFLKQKLLQNFNEFILNLNIVITQIFHFKQKNVYLTSFMDGKIKKKEKHGKFIKKYSSVPIIY